MSILVTGATSPLGAAVCRMLCARGDQVVGLGRRVTAFPADAGGRFRPVVGDLCDAAAVAGAVQGCTAIIHVAALSAPWGRKADFTRINVDATAALVAAARHAGVRRLVLVSSASVVFRGGDARDVDEAAPYPSRFLCHYSASKAAAEQVVLKAEGIETAIIRPRAIYGPGDRVLMPRILALARTGRLRQLGRRDVLQSLTYVDNAAHACVLALDGPSGRIWNVADAAPVHLWSTINRLLAQLGLPPAGPAVPATLVRTLAAGAETAHRIIPWLGEPRLTRYTAAVLMCDQTLCLAAITRDLGYRPLVSGDDGIARAAADLRSST